MPRAVSNKRCAHDKMCCPTGVSNPKISVPQITIALYLRKRIILHLLLALLQSVQSKPYNRSHKDLKNNEI